MLDIKIQILTTNSSSTLFAPREGLLAVYQISSQNQVMLTNIDLYLSYSSLYAFLGRRCWAVYEIVHETILYL